MFPENLKSIKLINLIINSCNLLIVPGQPTGLTAKVLDSHRIQLTWDKPLHSYNIIGYSIHFNASTGSSRELILTIPTEKHIIDGLLPDTFYSFRLGIFQYLFVRVCVSVRVCVYFTY